MCIGKKVRFRIQMAFNKRIFCFCFFLVDDEYNIPSLQHGLIYLLKLGDRYLFCFFIFIFIFGMLF